MEHFWVLQTYLFSQKKDMTMNENKKYTYADLLDSKIAKTPIYGVIKKVNSSGWDIDLYGIRALLPFRQMTNYYQANPDECIGRSFPFHVIDNLNPDSKVIIVSYKAYKQYSLKLEALLPSFIPNQQFECIICGTNKSGLLVSLCDIVGLIPRKFLSEDYRAIYKMGDIIKAYIQKSDVHKKRLFLSLKPHNDKQNIIRNVREKAYLKFTVDDIVSGVVKKIVPGGIIVSCEGGIDGLVNRNNMSREIATNISSNFVVGQNISVMVLSKDDDKLRLTLGIKQIADAQKRKERQRIKDIAAGITPGSILEATVTSFSPKKVSIELGENIPGTILQDDLAGGRIPISKKVFEGMRTPVVFLREDNGVLFFSTKLLEQAKYAPELFDYSTDELLNEIGIKHNSFVGKVIRQPNSDKMYINYLYAYSEEDNGLLLCDPYSGSAINLFVEFKYHNFFIDDEYYHIRIKALPPYERKKKDCPYLFELDTECLNDNSLRIEINPYKKLVEQTFMKQTSPSSNASLANLLEEVGQNMYDSKERMFFELLQNADDASAAKGVQVNLESLNGYILLTHNGLPFNRKDFVSITSAARSTKSGSKKKTGYKGIGFKSVFTNSSKVLLKTGGFFFTFDKGNPLFDDFDKYYLFVNDITEPRKQIEYLERFKDEKEEFKGVESIPWQLLPEWTDDIPEELQNTIFDKRENVSIALAMSDAVKSEYLESIKGVLNEPKFMLFLRHTNRLTFKEGDYSFILSKNRAGEIITLQSTLEEKERKQSFIVREADPIAVNSDYFRECGIDIIIETRYNSRSKRDEKVFVNSKGEKIASIPVRIAEAEDTLISYAFAVDDKGKYVPLEQSTTLFAYLPMTETRYPFPFYINADFILKSSREGVQSDNPWNFFVLYNIGREYVKWIGNAASIEQPNYLSLLLTRTFNEQTTGMRDLSKAFNEGYTKSLHEEPFIINDLGETVRMTQIILDHTCISDVIGADNFCFLVGCDGKRLPSKQINSKILDESIFSEIEHIKDVTTYLLEKKNRKYFRNWMHNSTKIERDGIFDWLIKQNNPGIIKTLPLFSFNGRYRAIDELNDNFLFIDSEISMLVEILNKIGFTCYDENIDECKLYQSYLRDGLLIEQKENAIRRIINRSETQISMLSVEDVVLLYSTVSPLCKKLHLLKELKSWELFSNINGDPCKLGMMIRPCEDKDEKQLFASRIINEVQYKVAKEVIEYELLPVDQFYSNYIYNNWDFIIQTWTSLGDERKWGDTEYIRIYGIIIKYYNAALTAAKHEIANGKNPATFVLYEISSLDSAFIWTGNTFKKASDVFFSSKLADTATYDAIAKLLNKPLPVKELITIFTKVPFTIKNNLFLSQNQEKDVLLSSSEITKIIDLCKSKQEKIFSKKIIEEKNSSFTIRDKEDGEWQFYYQGVDFVSFITKNCKDAFCLPSPFADYHSEEGVYSSNALFEKVFGIVNVNEKLSDILPIVLAESREIKYLFSNSIKSLSIKASDFTKSSLYTKLFMLLSELYADTHDCSTLRNIVSIEDSDGNSLPLASIPMQGTVSLGDHYFGLEELHPEDGVSIQKDAQLVLSQMRLVGIDDSFINSLFNLNATISADDIFNSLNTSKPLVNGEQLAFMLTYIKLKKIGTALPLIIYQKNSTTTQIANSCWLLNSFPFVDSNKVLQDKYHCFLEKFPRAEWDKLPLGMIVKKDTEALCFLKSSLTDEEKLSLFDYLFTHRNDPLNISTYLDKIEKLVGINSEDIVISACYALPSETLPPIVSKWIGDSLEKKEYIIKTFGLNDESSPIVLLREYFTKGISSGKNIFNLGDIVLQKKLCLWISSKKLQLDSRLYGNLSLVLDDTNLKAAINTAMLPSMTINLSIPDKVINKFSIFKINGQVPMYSYLPMYNNYIVYTYNKGDYTVVGNTIYVDNSQWSKLDKILQEIAVDNTNNFTANDYLQYRGNQNSLTDDEAEYLKAENNRLRALLERNNIFVSTSEDEYAGLSNEQKRAKLEEAKQQVLHYLQCEGFNIQDAVDDGWTCIDGVKDMNGIECPLVIRSYKNDARDFELNAGDWEQLTKSENSMLWIVTQSGCHSISFYDLVRNTRDRISFSFSTSNFDRKNRITALAEIMRYFKGIHFDFGSLIPDTTSIIQKFNQPEKELREILEGDNPDIMPS